LTYQLLNNLPGISRRKFPGQDVNLSPGVAPRGIRWRIACAGGKNIEKLLEMLGIAVWASDERHVSGATVDLKTSDG
jgi:hypothetical protein